MEMARAADKVREPERRAQGPGLPGKGPGREARSAGAIREPERGIGIEGSGAGPMSTCPHDGNRTVREAEAAFGSDLEELARVRSFIRGFCEATGDPRVGEEQIGRLELALTEAAANIIKHGYDGETGREIRVHAEVRGDRLTVRMRHHGKPFDPEHVSEPSFDGSRDSGFGLFIIRQCVEDLSFHQDAQGESCMCLVFNLNCLGKGGSHGDPR